MRLLAISDLHLNRAQNLAALRELPPHPDDWLMLAGDLGDGPEHLELAFSLLSSRFARLFWVPGNHELWATRGAATRGEARYAALIAVCRAWGVVTPEDPVVTWEGPGGPARVVPLFTLYDHSWRPDHVSAAGVTGWAAEQGIAAADDRLLAADPHPDVPTWAHDRVVRSRARLDALPPGPPLVLMTHYPLRQDLCRLPARIDRFTPWCGTTQTAQWHADYDVLVCVHGHLHMRSTDWRDGVRFEEVALGYPRHWVNERPLTSYLRTILPGPPPPPGGASGPDWHR